MKLIDLQEAGRGLKGATSKGPLLGRAIDSIEITKDRLQWWNGNFDAFLLNLTSLEGSPLMVKGKFQCGNNYLQTLKGGPDEVDDTFACQGNELTTLEGGPSQVDGTYNCSSNQLTDLKGAPKVIGSSFNCSDNYLTSLEGAPFEIGGAFECANNRLTSLKGVHLLIKKMKGNFNAIENPFESHLLGVLYIKGCAHLMLVDGKRTAGSLSGDEVDLFRVQEVINKFLPNELGHKNVIACQSRLLDLDLEKYAQL